ncbi:sulfur carrier protein ThiS [Cytobacillus gottheilii]|uniref:sulfur carrier protein ThiS n=1 Tax=Cytobacillus gottheilii TaxID=859144 RepID=UPI0009BBE63B|nr:sulfur carrier protein ThiS [Cytobacillus gottheilii]
MKIELNGKVHELPEQVKTTAQLLAFLKLQNRIVIVEINQDIVLKDKYESHQLSTGDKVELIHFVGGG